ncbi:helix-turn-helix domain-containing protein [Nocardia sp. SYP-A9097]|nr:helix-turn-helix domain-containing protein [Nocardia sp. SYP-A9097]
MRVGYVRVSAVDQNTARQLDGIAVDKTFTDKMSGKDTDRDQLTAMLGYVREGDTVVVHSMDRLARNLGDLLTLVQDLTARGVRVEFVKEVLTFTGEDSPIAQLMLSIMGAVAQFERAMIGERQREGIAKAKARGVYTGRKPALSQEQARELRARAAAGERKTALARAFGISRDTVYTYLQTSAPALPVDTRPLPDTAVSDQLLTRPRGAQASAPATEQAGTVAPASRVAPVPDPAPRRPVTSGSRRARWTTPGKPVRELVTVARDPEWGGYRVTDRDGTYLGTIQRQTKTSGKGRWQGHDEHNQLITPGLWNTVDDAVAGLLQHHLDRDTRRAATAR